MSKPTRTFDHIPVVDISGLYSDKLTDRQQVAKQIADAATNVGFLYITGHRIPQSLIDALLVRTKEFFARPYREKMRYYIGNSSNHSGYVPEGEEQFYGGKIDHKEAYDINNDLGHLSQQGPMIGPTQWPDMADFKEDVSAYYQAALNLGQLLFRGFALALDLPEDTFDDKVKNPPSQLRLIHYPYNPDAQDREGIGAHTDYECFTLLLPTTDGLEVLNDNGEWIDAPVIPGSFVVNIGDMMEILSNGRFIATSHRVRKVKEERYSFPLFCSCDYDTIIEPLVDPAPGIKPGTYQPMCCGDHLLAQTMHTFHYLKERIAKGELQFPDSSADASSFGKLREVL
ncbi:2-oxoglutarate and iron-dependent oxygenase domain-containing protein [Microbulbifer thermotolerans]|uniref:isopenicillin N synthase family dioxygenase n=1 Tax=Microbulbifer thermotolerans TaxID=252514 RepID=UPI00224B6BDD|nr:2-oxoglutarate and iron-dependent oxygenase domain-containing protein [Microbulbifer thermotolerans]MCX2833833.1 isopenicillin N synthase family oxygenase [Microbulbifer thermotolerans]MCX2841857.1 isopenicillin N synthase family oxygenase [Microbulbifer thermotolerans]WKT59308.1 2-oxoglutarate and iron-dependent oxygenase domain-containing protein [Microbulbifer thermotolerans]